MIVGLGGKYCAGKDTVMAILRDYGYRELSVDALGHTALKTRRDAVVDRFGPDILAGDTIDRRALGRRVFSNTRERRALEAIVHPEMKRLLDERITTLKAAVDIDRNDGGPGYPRLVINAALIFYMELHTLCDLVIWVRASLVRRYIRARRRDELSVKDVLSRFWSQRHLGPHSYGEYVDIHIVNNEGTNDGLRGQLDAIGLLTR